MKDNFETKRFPLSFDFKEGSIRLEITSGPELMLQDMRLIVPIIRLNPFALTNQTVFDVEDLESHLLRNIMIKLKEFEIELKENDKRIIP